MAFPIGWTRRCALAVQHGQVPANQTAFPVLITEACLPNEILTSGGGNAAQSDGGDIRFSSDVAGASQLACEVVLWTQNANPALAKAEIWVPVNVLTASDVTIYIWYNAGGGLTQPAANAAFGSQAVWDSNYKAAWHFPDGVTLNVQDSTGNTTQSGANTLVADAGQIDGSANSGVARYTHYDNVAGIFDGVNAKLTIEGWFKTTGTGMSDTAFGFHDNSETGGYPDWWGALMWSPNQPLVLYRSSSGNHAYCYGTFTFSASTWYHVVFTLDLGAATGAVYVNGSLTTGGYGSAGTPPTVYSALSSGFRLGANGTSFLTGWLDEFRLSKTIRSATWAATGYNNQSSPSSFLVAGTPGGVGTTESLADSITLSDAAVRRIDNVTLLADTLSFSDFVAQPLPTFGDTLQFFDDFLVSVTFGGGSFFVQPPVQTDTLNLTDDVFVQSLQTIFPPNPTFLIADTISLSDQADFFFSQATPLADTLALSDTVSLNLTQGAVVGDTISLSDARGQGTQVLSDTLSLFDSATILVGGPSFVSIVALVGDTLILEDGFAYLRPISQVAIGDRICLHDSFGVNKRSTRNGYLRRYLNDVPLDSDFLQSVSGGPPPVGFGSWDQVVNVDDLNNVDNLT